MNPIYLVIAVIILGIVSLVLRFKKDIKIEEEKKKSIIENIDSVVLAGVTALIIITFVIRTFYIPSSSMVPTLKINDFIIVNKFVYALDLDHGKFTYLPDDNSTPEDVKQIEETRSKFDDGKEMTW